MYYSSMPMVEKGDAFRGFVQRIECYARCNQRRTATPARSGFESPNYVLKTKTAPTPGPAMDFKVRVKGYRH